MNRGRVSQQLQFFRQLKEQQSILGTQDYPESTRNQFLRVYFPVVSKLPQLE